MICILIHAHSKLEIGVLSNRNSWEESLLLLVLIK